MTASSKDYDLTQFEDKALSTISRLSVDPQWWP